MANKSTVQQLPNGQITLNIPRAIAHAMGYKKGDTVRVVSKDRDVLQEVEDRRGSVAEKPRVQVLQRDVDVVAEPGLGDRGLLQRGYKADINVIDYDRLTLHAPTVLYDLPSGGRRLMQYADGYAATIVNGQPIYLNGQATGALPGRLVRGARDLA